MIDLRFPVQGQSVPVDHGFALYGAISKICPLFHTSENVMFMPIGGRYAGKGLLTLNRHSKLTIRFPSEKIPQFLDLAGKTFSIDLKYSQLWPLLLNGKASRMEKPL